VETGDLLTLVGGVIIVVIIALIANPHYLSELSPAQPTPVPTTVPPVLTPLPTRIVPLTPVVTAVPTIAPPYRITYSSDPFKYPKFKMPDNMGIFGADDLPIRNREMVTFAYINETRGGLTQMFHVSYPLWVLKTTVIANRTPQYGNFKMVLCYGNNGTVINGEEILNRGSMTRVVETSGTDVYMIITTAYIDSFHIELQTPRDYYENFSSTNR
jgi:hypothetical protein